MQDGALTLPPSLAVGLVLVMALCGQAFRSNWKRQGPGWVARAWALGIPAAVSLLILAFVPLRYG